MSSYDTIEAKKALDKLADVLYNISGIYNDRYK